MATGDQSDVAARLSALIPTSWFPQGLTPFVSAAIAGIAAALSPIYALLAYLRLQTRISTATDGFLELIAADYFGDKLPRLAGQLDPSYRAAILAGIFRERGTRRGVVLILEQLTGRTPKIFEPMRPADTGGYRTNALFYGQVGAYGSQLLPMQALVIAYRPLGTGIPNVAGYGIPVAGYDVGSQSEYASLDMLSETITDDDIYAAVNSVRPTCATLWVGISS